MHVHLLCINEISLHYLCKNDKLQREIIESSGGPRHLSTIPLKTFYLFKIAESVINLCLKKFLTNNFKQLKVF